MNNNYFILYLMNLTYNTYIKHYSVNNIRYIYIYLATRNSSYLFIKPNTGR